MSSILSTAKINSRGDLLRFSSLILHHEILVDSRHLPTEPQTHSNSENYELIAWLSLTDHAGWLAIRDFILKYAFKYVL